MGARLVADRQLVGTVEAMVRKRVPPSEVDDIVQAALTDAVASNDVPSEAEAMRRWLAGVVRHKIADFYRRRDRERALDSAPELAHVPAHEERDLLRWASRQLPTEDAQRTLDWMMHEADGEKLESIAEREQIPATRVRQRVSRLRSFFRERWSRELMLASIVLVLLGVAYALFKSPPLPIAKDPPSQQRTTPQLPALDPRVPLPKPTPRDERQDVPDLAPTFTAPPVPAPSAAPSARTSSVRPRPTSVEAVPTAVPASPKPESAPPSAPSEKIGKPSGASIGSKK